MLWFSGKNVLVDDRSGFDSLVQSEQRLQILVFTASLLDVQY